MHKAIIDKVLQFGVNDVLEASEGIVGSFFVEFHFCDMRGQDPLRFNQRKQ
jgi:hypothetical protein